MPQIGRYVMRIRLRGPPCWANNTARFPEVSPMFQPNLLKGRTILITGGGTGLGRAMALRFAELGANLFLIGRREDPLKQTVADLQAKGGRAAWFSADIRDFDAVE